MTSKPDGKGIRDANLPSEFLNTMDEKEKHLLGNVIKGYSKLKKDVETQQQYVDSPLNKDYAPPDPTSVEFVGKHMFRPSTAAPKPPKIHIPAALRNLDREPRSTFSPIVSSRSSTQLGTPTLRPSSSQMSIKALSPSMPSRPKSGGTTSSIRSIRTITQARMEQKQSPPQSHQTQKTTKLQGRQTPPALATLNLKKATTEDPNILFSARTLSQRPNSPNSIILKTDFVDQEVPAWRNVKTGFSPGPNYRPASKNQRSRFYGPMGTAPANFPNPPPKEVYDHDVEKPPSERIGVNLTPSAKDISPRRMKGNSRPTSAASTHLGDSRTGISRSHSSLTDFNTSRGDFDSTESLSTFNMKRSHSRIDDLDQTMAWHIFQESEQYRDGLDQHTGTISDVSFIPLELFDNPELEVRSPEEWVLLAKAETFGGFSLYYFPDGKYEWKPCNVLDYNRIENSFLIQWSQTGKKKHVKRLNLRFEVEDEKAFNQRIARAYELKQNHEASLRYYACIDTLPDGDIAPIEATTMDRILRQISAEFPVEMLSVIEKTFNDLQQDYVRAMKKARFDYGMLDQEEVEKFSTLNLPLNKALIFVPKNGLIEVPHYDFQGLRTALEKRLLFANPRFLSFFHDLSVIIENSRACRLYSKPDPNLSMSISEFSQTILDQIDTCYYDICMQTVPNISNLIHTKLNGVFKFTFPTDEDYYKSDTLRILRLIDCRIDSLVKEIVDFSVLDLVNCFNLYEYYRNSRQEEYLPISRTQNIGLISSPLFLIRIVLDQDKICYDPTIPEIKDSVLSALDSIAKFASKVAKVEGSALSHPKLPLTHFTPYSDADHLLANAKSRLMRILNEDLDLVDGLMSSYKLFENLLHSPEHLQQLVDAIDISNLDGFRENVKNNRTAASEAMMRTPNRVNFGLIAVDCQDLKLSINQRSTETSALLLQSLTLKIQQHNKRITDSFTQIRENILRTPKNAEEWSSVKADCENIEESLSGLEKDMSLVQTAWAMIEEFEYQVPTEDFTAMWQAKAYPKSIREEVETRTNQLVGERQTFVSQLQKNTMELQATLLEIQEEVDSFYNLGDIEKTDENAAKVVDLQTKIAEAQEQGRLYNSRESMFGLTKSPFPLLTQVQKNLEPFAQLWSISAEFMKEYPLWMDGPFTEVDAEKAEENVSNWRRTLQKVNRILRDATGPLSVGTEVKDKLDEFHKHMPLFKCLRNPGLVDRHWIMISQLGFPQIRPESMSELNFSMLLDMNLEDKLPEIMEISEVAGKEYLLEKALENMVYEWKTVNFETMAYRDSGTHILRKTDDIITLLDDQIAKTQSMRGSPFIKALEGRVRVWEEKLLAVQSIMEEWLTCQKTYLYLEPIFGSKDIIAQMPNEGKKFQIVDTIWRKNMEATVKNPNVMAILARYNMKQNFVEANQLLEEIQKGLEDYLETKRGYFPRFFFLSNDELLEILSKTRDASAVQPHLKKCFENIDKLAFSPDGKVTAMLSSEDESIPFLPTHHVQTSPKVEEWLLGVEEAMLASLQHIMADSLADHPMHKREDWILRWPGQVILAVNKVMWTRKTHQSLREGIKHLRDHEHQLSQALLKLVEMVRGDLPSLARLTMESLIVLDVHGRDVISKLVQAEVTSEDSFEWTSQLRYYWESGHLSVRMVMASLAYAYEYLGNTARLVITPLTDRCYITLMSALHLHYGGAPEGPAGTGKTETTKDLAKAVAKQCVVFNCSDGLDYIAMGKFFKGIASSGAWCCFDEFNRIDVEVLSVIAQQILTIQRAIGQNKAKFNFEGREIKLNASCAVFITMNPGYAGRSELPDNLKALFRPVAMMVPDYAMIAEISLLSYGFSDARNLSRKVVSTFKLSSEQLSSQHHYDFGMRAVKAVLRAAGVLRRKLLDEKEALLVLRALNDVNLPKFVAEDLPLFDGIIRDLFPGVALPDGDYKDLISQMHIASKSLGLQPVPALTNKMIQLFDTLEVRHGVMLVGETFSGKTSCIKVLSNALTALESDPRYYAVKISSLNPKSVTMGQLYGQSDLVSHEWTDGILAQVVRESSQDTSPAHKWIVFDGPVDSLWIENMNSALDDSKKLCLNSGEVIWLTPTMAFVFEVGDLSMASPATVSRCGMIYMEPSLLGWIPLLDSWMDTLEENLAKLATHIRKVFLYFVPPLLTFVRKQTREMVPQIDTTLIKSTISLLTCLSKNAELFQNEESARTTFESFFVFALVWSVGANTDDAGRKKFDKFLRDLIAKSGSTDFGGLSTLFPDVHTVYDYVYKPERGGQWVMWMDAFPIAPIPEDIPTHELLIPTVDTVRYSYLLSTYIESERSILFVGSTGTGKTAIMKSTLLSCESETTHPMFITFSGRTSANQTQDIIDAKLEKRRKNIFGPVAGTKLLIMIDDLNMPAKEKFGAQPAIELLRQWMDSHGWYDRKTNTFHEIADVIFSAAMAPPGGGRNSVTSRYLRHYHVIGITPPDDANLKRIYGSILTRSLKTTPSAFQDAIVAATLDIYRTITAQLLPTPAKSHYLYNTRDLSRVFQGLSTASDHPTIQADEIVSLWSHECCRVFADRLVNDEDRVWFRNMMQQIGEKYLAFKGPLFDEKLPLLYGDFLESDQKRYSKLPPMSKLVPIIQGQLEEYNNYSRKPMSLVMFSYAVEHMTRIARILRQPSGHALLVGVEGSGRKSMTTLAAHVCGQEVFTLDMGRSYGFSEWREDMRRLMRKGGVDGMGVVFLISDQQLVNDAFLEDVNNILNTGEVPNLFQGDDLMMLLNDMQSIALQYNRADNKSQILDLFWSRCKQYIHVIICMSPVGDTLRNRLRLFPSLVNCCTIDWFPEWPDSALKTVASTSLSDLAVDPDVSGGLVNACVRIHQDVEKMNERYLRELKRHFYVSPTSYLEFLSVFKKLLDSKRQEVMESRRRYDNGLQKLLSTEEEVGEMQKELVELKPLLITMSQKTDDLMKSIQADQEEAAVTKAVVEKDEASATLQAEEARKIKEECEADLQEVMPTLFDAQKALETLNKNDVSEVKSMKNPPEGVRKVMEAVCIMLDIKPTLLEGNRMGKKVYDYWESSKKMLSDSKFLQTLQAYDKDNIAPGIIEKIVPYIKDKTFEPSVMQKVSIAATSLCMWVRAIYRYHKVYRVVAPKKAALRQAEEEFTVTMETVAAKKKILEETETRIRELMAKYEDALSKKNDLQSQVQSVEKKLDRAQRLIKGLAGEKDRWNKARHDLQEVYSLLVGDVLLSSALISYLGAFTVAYRTAAIESWVGMIRELRIPCSSPFNFIHTLGDSLQIRQWQLDGLPPDRFSVENALIVMKTGGRWPLMLDPQGQAAKWIKKMEGPNRIDVIRPADSDIMRRLENAVQFGYPVLIENLGEMIDPQLYPIILKSTFRQGGQLMISIGGNTVMFSPSFRLYLTTKLPNPHYKPEICTRVALVNFVTTVEGVQDQLLGIVVAKERQELEEEKNYLVVQNAGFQSELKRLEDQILGMLSSADGNFLENEALIETLNAAKKTSQEIAEKMELAAETEQKIDMARADYKPVAALASLLYFCVTDMSNLEPMYQYSLTWFTNLFVKAIAAAEPSNALPQRLKNLNGHFMYSLYRNVCQSLFEKDKLLFSFLVAVRQQMEDGKISALEWRHFLTGGSSLGASPPAKPQNLSWLPDNMWQDVDNLSHLPIFRGIHEAIARHAPAWQTYLNRADLISTPVPEPYDAKLSAFQKLCLLRSLRPDQVLPTAQAFVSAILDPRFIEPPPFDLMKSYMDSDNKTPIVFILSSGMDPMEEFTSLALKLGFRDKTSIISLGQGQGPLADRMVHEGSDKGRWVLLQNCHLATSWMTNLEHITEELFSPSYLAGHPDFRLWLTSKPTSTFPVSILQNGIKLTNEPPKGIRANLVRSYLAFDATMANSIPSERQRAFKKLLFGLSFFHALIQERRKYGPLGWNNIYEFSEADLRISVKQLHEYMIEGDAPYKAIRYLTGEANYGGRVTDSWDRRTLTSLLEDFYSDRILDDKYRFSPSGLYYAPADGSFLDYVGYVKKLPLNDKPEICGLHENADITYARNETTQLTSSLLLMQPRSAASGGDSQEQVLQQVVTDVLGRIPNIFNAEEIAKRHPVRYEDCMTTVLLQEVIRYNGLLSRMHSSLKDIQNAVKGLVVMSNDLEIMANNLFDGQVPVHWAKIAYESRKPLASWVTDLLARIKFIQSWSNKGPPDVFWLSGFFYPQAFLTGQLQNFARRHFVAIDHVAFDYHVMPGPCKDAAANGCYVDGLFLEGAKWELNLGRLAEPQPKELLSSMPVIWLNPYDTTKRSRDSSQRYACPVYKTSKRSGVLSSTGHSTNYVLTIELTTTQNPSHWVKRGVALICQTDF